MVLLDFIYWWYAIFVKEFWLNKVFNKFIYNLNSTNTLSMAKNISAPLYQDNSSLGRSLGFILRFFWIAVGSSTSLIWIIPNLVIGIFLTFMPLIPIVQLFRFILSIL